MGKHILLLLLLTWLSAPPTCWAAEQAQVEAILADRDPGGADPRFVAAVRLLRNRGGQFEFDDEGNLVGVDLAGNRTSVADADIPFLRVLPHVRKLKLSGGGISNAGVQELATMTRLGELTLLDAQIDDAALESIAGLNDLALLSIRRSPAITDQGLRYLKRLSKLGSLGLLELGITDAGVDLLVELPGLRLLDLRGCTQITTEGLSRLADLKDLKCLRIGGYQIDDATMSVLAKMPSLVSVTIEEAAVTDAGLARLTALPIEELNLSRCYGVTDEAFEQIRRLKKLRRLSLRGIPIVGDHLSDLQGLSDLAVLQLNETGVGDEAMEALGGLGGLTRLELRQTQISDKALAAIGSLAQLEVLDISQTGISDDGRKALARALPHCRILPPAKENP